MIVRSIEEEKEGNELSPRINTVDYADADNEDDSPGKDFISNQLAKPSRSPLGSDNLVKNEIFDDEFL
jgi:hypothetical protein